MAGGGRRLCLTLAEIGLSTPTVADVTILANRFVRERRLLDTQAKLGPTDARPEESQGATT